MDFSQTVYFNDTPLILTTNKTAYIDGNPHASEYPFFNGLSLRNYTPVVQALEKNGAIGVIIEGLSVDALLEQLQSAFHVIDAGGGVVYNEAGEILMIFRRGKWDLPKGKLDSGESIEDCAVREVKEETGLKRAALGAKICDTYHIYIQKNEQILKRTAWYKMNSSVQEKLRPQKQENIIEARWVSPQKIAPFAAQSYEAVRDVLKASGILW